MDSHIVISLFHILAVVPFLMWVGISRNTLPQWVYYVLIALGAILVLYHGYKAVIRIMKGSSYAWVNLIHSLWIGPLLLYIGIKNKETPRPAYELLLLTTFAALGYHMYSLATQYEFL
jgi:hypothetical protein